MLSANVVSTTHAVTVEVFFSVTVEVKTLTAVVVMTLVLFTVRSEVWSTRKRVLLFIDGSNDICRSCDERRRLNCLSDGRMSRRFLKIKTGADIRGLSLSPVRRYRLRDLNLVLAALLWMRTASVDGRNRGNVGVCGVKACNCFDRSCRRNRSL